MKLIDGIRVVRQKTKEERDRKYYQRRYQENKKQVIENSLRYYQENKEESKKRFQRYHQERKEKHHINILESRKHPLKPWQDPESLFCDTEFLKKIIGKEPLKGKECKDDIPNYHRSRRYEATSKERSSPRPLGIKKQKMLYLED